MKKKLYLIGSLRNTDLPSIGRHLRASFDVFDDWYAAGPEADDKWMLYEKLRERTYQQALEGYAADHVFSYDHEHLDEAEIVVLVTPAGKSSHLELGYALGQGKVGIIYVTKEPERWDVMVKFATHVVFSLDELDRVLQTI